MTKSTTIWIVILLVILIGGLSYYFSRGNYSDNMMDDEDKMMTEDKFMMDDKDGAMMDEGEVGTMMDDGDTMMTSDGSYQVYSPEKIALASKGDLVLFFRATWCPTCKALDENIKENISKIPSGLTILDVDYDKYTELKQKYGVTYQHTMVQVDASGNLITKWSGSPTLSDLVSKIK